MRILQEQFVVVMKTTSSTIQSSLCPLMSGIVQAGIVI